MFEGEDRAVDGESGHDAREDPSSRRLWLLNQVVPHERALRQWLARCGRMKHCEIDDIVQDVFVRLMQTSQVGHIDCIQSYVWQTARSVLCSRARRAAIVEIDVASHELFDQVVCDAPRPDQIALERDLLERFHRHLARLPHRTRRMILLKLDNFSSHEVAARLEVSVSTVQKDCRNALASLKRKLER